MDFLLLRYSNNWTSLASKKNSYLKVNEMFQDRSSGKLVNCCIAAVNFLSYSRFLTKPSEITACQP